MRRRAGLAPYRGPPRRTRRLHGVCSSSPWVAKWEASEPASSLLTHAHARSRTLALPAGVGWRVADTRESSDVHGIDAVRSRIMRLRDELCEARDRPWP